MRLGGSMRIRFGRTAALGLTSAILFTGAGLVAGAGGAGAASSAKSYEVMVVGTLTGSAAYTTPEIVAATEGAFRGVNGAKIITCDDQGSSSQATACEHEAVVDHVAAVIVGANSYVGQNES